MLKKDEYLYIGLDIHKESHTAVLMNYLEEPIGKIKIRNNISGFKRLYAYVQKYKEKLTPMFGLEDVTHYGRSLAIYLLEKDDVVKEVNSALSYMERMSYATTKKNDTWDAQCICSVLIRRQELLPDANPQDYYWTMKHLVNRRNALVKANTALLRQFHDQIQNTYPSYKKFFKHIEGSASMAFYEQYPSPGCLEETNEEELGAFLREHSNNTCSNKRAEFILNLIEADAVRERDYQYARDYIIQSMIRNMRFNLEEMKRLEEVQAELLKELNYHLETIPGVGTVTASALVGNIGDIKRFKSANKLASFAGIAPLYSGSAGKGRNYQNKSLGNRELYNVFYFLAIQQVQLDKNGEPRCKEMRDYFEYKVSHGKTKVQALLCIMRKLVRIVYSMMKHESVFRMPESSIIFEEQKIS